MDTLYEEALERLQQLLKAADESDLPEPTAMTLATVDEQGRPSARTVLLKGMDSRGLVFYTNTQSRKGEQLARRPRAALCLYWQPLKEQITVEGDVGTVTEEEADAYWASRPRESQVGGWASQQSRPLTARQELLSRADEYRRRFEGAPVPRPPHWSGYRVIPDRIEFWTAGDYRLHHRRCYVRSGGGWSVTLLNP